MTSQESLLRSEKSEAAARTHGITLNGRELRIRPYRDADSDEVQRLFYTAMGTGPGSPYRLALHALPYQPAAYVTYAVFGSALLLFNKPSFRLLGFGLSLGAGTAFFLYRRYLFKACMDYCQSCLDSDLADIGGHYGMRDNPAIFHDEMGAVEVAKEPPEILSSARSCSNRFWVVEDLSQPQEGQRNAIIGSVGLDGSNCEDPSVAEMRRMVVSPYHRRRGIGALLVRTVLDHARKYNISTILLTSTTYQPGAIKMYANFGWKPTGKKILLDRVTNMYLMKFKLDLPGVQTL
ncbi:acyl-CoA N-acyltransferase [Crucibulum laeve]|uniref:Acyl-CoA N-acyltransferase n=1 Tax=Crucibulum laeve TaxID=68775 RepID=A0A5C3LR19_9AGAR|nr:acyl-CoA N-acyltransferase [Crucibulum laeve]